MSNTYGTWLPGDPRGFRIRGHSEHVEGDYKSPPKEDYTARHEQSKKWLKQEPVFLSPVARAAAVHSIRVTLIEVHRLELLAVSVSAMHLHLLCRFPRGQKPTPPRGGLPPEKLPLRLTDPVRYHVGVAKERSAKFLAAEGLVRPGKVWAKRGKIKPIKDRHHHVRVFRYILDHAAEGAAVWSYRDGTDSVIQPPP